MNNQIGYRSIYYSELESTQKEMFRLIDSGQADHGLVIQTGFQLQGKGQRTKQWESERGKNLLCSLLLQPYVEIDKQFHLNFAVSLALFDTSILLLPEQEVKIKWPNDILISGKKIAGILIENQIQGGKIKNAVVGIGYNVAQEIFSTKKPAVSLCDYNPSYEPGMVLNTFCDCLSKRYNQLLNRDFHGLHQDFNAHLFGREKKRKFTDLNGNHFIAVVKEARADGFLVLNVDGEDQNWSNGEIIWEDL